MEQGDKRHTSFKKTHPIWKWTKRFLKLMLLMFIIGILGVTTYIYIMLETVPKVSTTALKSDESSNMYSSNGTLIWSSAREKRIYVKIKDVPKTYKDLLLSTEDSGFYKNSGFSYKGITNAGLSYIKAKLGHGEARGGSGIEQQLIKLTVFSTSADDRTISRKVKELYLASQLDKNYSKNKILEFYINKIYEGENSYGAQTISYTYFNKPLNQLTLSQQAIIAGLGQSPSAYNLYTNPKLVQQRRDVVLSRAYTNKKITEAQYTQAKNASVTDGLIPRYSRDSQVENITKQHNAFVQSALAQLKSLGYDLNKIPLQVTTTLDIDDENYVKDLFDNHPEYWQGENQQAAITITDPQTGHVLVQVGGRHSNTISGLNRATQLTRSSGSVIKPILDYGPGFEYFNWATNKSVDDSAYHYAGTNYNATSYGGTTHGIVPLQTALRQSYNPPAIRALDSVGEIRAAQFIKKLGVQSNGQTLAGQTAINFNVSTSEVASALGAFGQSGVYHPTQYISSLKFPDNSVKKITFKPVQAMRASTAYIMTAMLKGVISDKGTMKAEQISGITAAGKSGTNGYPSNVNVPANAAMDIWKAAYTKSISLAFWSGYDNPLQANSYISPSWEFGSSSAALYKAIMSHISQGKDSSDWSQPSTVTKLNGSGLDANYVANDSPIQKAKQTLQKPSMTTQDYSAINKTVKKKKAKMPKTPSVPKSYVKGKWEKQLQKAKNKFNKAHANDKEEAAKVGANE